MLKESILDKENLASGGERYYPNQEHKGPDEVIAESTIWLKLYQMNICNLSRKDQQSFFQNMN